MEKFKSTLCLLVVFLCCFSTSCGNRTDDNDHQIEGLQAGSIDLKMPLPPGYQWRVNTTVNDGGDRFHQKNGYYSIDFGRWQQKAGGVLFDAANSSSGVEILAAEDGVVIKIVDGTCTEGTTICPPPATGTACAVYIDHGNGFATKYLHFKNHSLKVRVGTPVKRGQPLGLMGNTGISCGDHLHFQLLHENGASALRDSIVEYGKKTYYFTSSLSDPALLGAKIEGVKMEDYKYHVFYPSTNGFTFNPLNNPTLCQDAPTGSAATNWVYTCTPKTGSVKVKEAVFGLIGIEKIAHNFGWKAEVRNPAGSLIQTYQWDATSVDPWGWDRSYYWPWVYPDTPGKWELRYFVKTNDSFPTYPMAVLPFTVSDAPPYTYNGNGLTCSDKPTGSAATNWVYTCAQPKSTFSSAFNPTVYGLLYVENIFKNFKFVTKVFNNGQYLFTHDPITFTIVEPWIWRYAYAFPEIQRPLPGTWRMEVYLVYDDGKPGVHLKDLNFVVTF